MDLSFGRLRNVTFLSGHGPLHPGPTIANFQRVDQAIVEHRGSWEAFWRAYLLLRMYMSNQLQESLNKGKFNVIRSLFKRVPAAPDRWSVEHTAILIEMITNPD